MLYDFCAQLIHQIRVKHRPSADKSGIQHRCQNFIILAGQRQTLLQRAGGIADIQADVPQRINDFLDQIFGFLGYFLFKQKQQVDIGMDALLLSAVAALSNNGIRVFANIHARTHHAGFKCLTKIIVQ